MGPQVHLRTWSPDATRKLAQTLAGALRPGDVLALTGELGAGKTCFVQGAASALGVSERVVSPSFLLRRDYEGRIPVIHIDVYRLDTLEDVEELGYDEVFDGTHVTFIEWGDAMNPLLPTDHLEVELHRAPDDVGTHPGSAAHEPPGDEEERRVTLRPHGDDWRRRLPALAVDLQAWRLGE